MLPWLGSVEGSCLGLKVAAFSLCPHLQGMGEECACHLSCAFSHKDINPIKRDIPGHLGNPVG